MKQSEQNTAGTLPSTKELVVTRHAANRYCERKKINSVSAASASILELLSGAKELELKKKFRSFEALNHRDAARFFRAAGLVFVVTGGVVATVHDGAAKRWRNK